eukprot:scaffold432507_cov71-Attheya_sp.AAC.1
MKYAIQDDNRPCEHVVFHECLRSLNPSIKITVQPYMNTLWDDPDLGSFLFSGGKIAHGLRKRNGLVIRATRPTEGHRLRNGKFSFRIDGSGSLVVEQTHGESERVIWKMTPQSESFQEDWDHMFLTLERNGELVLSQQTSRQCPSSECYQAVGDKPCYPCRVVVWSSGTQGESDFDSWILQLGKDGVVRVMNSDTQETLWRSAVGSGIVSLMSFPNSGTTYTLGVVANVSTVSAATNYGDETEDELTSIYEGGYSGPFWIPQYGGERTTKGLVITKTHCGGRCIMCRPAKWILTHEEFMNDCLRYEYAAVRDDSLLYDFGFVEKIIHLVRDPMDNIVSRFHHERNEHMPEDDKKVYAKNSEGFREFCSDRIDRPHWDRELGTLIDTELWEVLKEVPCHTDFLRYLYWHNHVFQITEEAKKPNLLIHYERYGTHWNETLTELLSFLGQSVKGHDLFPYIGGKNYRHFYEDWEVDAVLSACKAIATERTWSSIRHYFEGEAPRITSNEVITGSSTNMNKGPDIAWLMSFPNSGTSYTLRVLRTSSTVSGATNYGGETGNQLSSVYKGSTSGPFWIPDRGFRRPPNGLIITKTFCGGYSIKSSPIYSNLTRDQFLNECLRYENKPIRDDALHYDIDLVKKMVHLIRDPFDNIVSRFHHAPKSLISEEEKHLYEDNSRGFRSFCSDKIDRLSWDRDLASFLGDKLWDVIKEIPCRTDFLRYIFWHNHVFQIAEDTRLPNLIIYFERYDTHWNETIAELLSFLGQRLKGRDPVHFVGGKAYRNFYNDGEVDAIRTAYTVLATKETWESIQHYFVDESLDSDSTKVSTLRLSEKIPGNANIGYGPDIAWLMSFPNSGTSYTLRVLRTTAAISGATNYGGETKDRVVSIYDGKSSGPFWIPDRGFERPMNGLVITKTHCGGYFLRPRPSSSLIISEDQFLNECLRYEVEAVRGINHQYDNDLVKKIVHLVRDPFDNIVSRFHHERKIRMSEEEKQIYEISSKGFRAFCSDKIDLNTWDSELSSFVGDTVWDIMKDVPCRTDFLRYIFWHINAFQVAEQTKLPIMMVHYERYDTHWNETLTDLLDFLGHSVEGEKPATFIKGKTYRHLFEDREVNAIRTAYKTLATKNAWSNIRHYFGDESLEIDAAEVSTIGSTKVNNGPGIVWLMSFPNSGTSYTLWVLRIKAAVSGATNYGGETNNELASIYQGSTSGPFWIPDRGFERPTNGLVITKTHCCGYSLTCPSSSSIVSQEKFVNECLRYENKSVREDNLRYDFGLVKQMVHVVRDPFDNIVSRFHHERKTRMSEEEKQIYENNSEGFRAFCVDKVDLNSWNVDVTSVVDDISWSMLKNVPCHTDFLRYIFWHNHAFQITEEKKLPTLRVYYERYGTHWNETVTELLSFLGRPAKGRDEATYIGGKTYRHFYNEGEVNAIRTVYKSLATKNTWSNIRHYFGDESLESEVSSITTDVELHSNDGQGVQKKKAEGHRVHHKLSNGSDLLPKLPFIFVPPGEIMLPVNVGRNEPLLTWGGAIFLDPVSSEWNLFAMSFTHECRLGQGRITNSKIIRATSQVIDGPFVYNETVMDTYNVNIDFIMKSDGSLVAFVIGDPNKRRMCKNGSLSRTACEDCDDCACNKVESCKNRMPLSGNQSRPYMMYPKLDLFAMFADTVEGPWTEQSIVLPVEVGAFQDTSTYIDSNGTVTMVLDTCTVHDGNRSCFTIVEAKDGCTTKSCDTWETVGIPNFLHLPANCSLDPGHPLFACPCRVEHPTIWFDKPMRKWRMLMHQYPSRLIDGKCVAQPDHYQYTGGYAETEGDSAAGPWTYDYFHPAYNSVIRINLEDGERGLYFNNQRRRERPNVMLGKEGGLDGGYITYAVCDDSFRPGKIQNCGTHLYEVLQSTTTAQQRVSGTIYMVTHSETSGYSFPPHAIGPFGRKRAEYRTSLFNGSRFKAPNTIIAAQVVDKVGRGQRMEHSVVPIAKSLGINVTIGPTLIDTPKWTHEPAREAAQLALTSLSNGTVLISMWSFILEFCAQLGTHCENFNEPDDVITIEVQDGDVISVVRDVDDFVNIRFHKHDWLEIPSAIRDAWKVIGYNQKIWDMEPKARPTEVDLKTWTELTAVERKAVIKIGFNEKSWEKERKVQEEYMLSFEE